VGHVQGAAPPSRRGARRGPLLRPLVAWDLAFWELGVD
jgi:hypothetical protein